MNERCGKFIQRDISPTSTCIFLNGDAPACASGALTPRVPLSSRRATALVDRVNIIEITKAVELARRPWEGALKRQLSKYLSPFTAPRHRHFPLLTIAAPFPICFGRFLYYCRQEEGCSQSYLGIRLSSYGLGPWKVARRFASSELHLFHVCRHKERVTLLFAPVRIYQTILLNWTVPALLEAVKLKRVYMEKDYNILSRGTTKFIVKLVIKGVPKFLFGNL